MKVLVTGSNGQLGNEIRRLAPQFPELTFIHTDIQELDITSEKALEGFFEVEKPEVVINCAAYTAVDKAEQEETLAYLINSNAVGNLARVTARNQAHLIHISTDYVFDGRGFRLYTETDVANPVSTYGKSKFAGEKMIQSHAVSSTIIRTSWLYSEFGGNFVKTILQLALEHGKINVVYDQIGSPTYAGDLAEAILIIIRDQRLTEHVEVFHYANEGAVSWLDFAHAIIELTGIECTLNAIETKDFPRPAVRPFYSVLNKTKIKNRLQIEIPYWRNSLKVCLDRLMNQE